jgi:hypothetical protein
MVDPFSDVSYQYKGQVIGAGIHGILGGVGAKITSSTFAAKPYYYKRTIADFYYRVQNNIQNRVPWPGSDPTGSRLPELWRLRLIDGVRAWQVLSESEKQAYRELARYHPTWTGYNLFISEYLLSY